MPMSRMYFETIVLEIIILQKKEEEDLEHILYHRVEENLA